MSKSPVILLVFTLAACRTPVDELWRFEHGTERRERIAAAERRFRDAPACASVDDCGRRCEDDDGRSCTRAGRLLSDRIGGAASADVASVQAASRYHLLGCVLGDDVGCCQYASALLAMGQGAGDARAERQLQAMRGSCDRVCRDGTLAEVLEVGAGVAECRDRACGLGDKASCDWLRDHPAVAWQAWEKYRPRTEAEQEAARVAEAAKRQAEVQANLQRERDAASKPPAPDLSRALLLFAGKWVVPGGDPERMADGKILDRFVLELGGPRPGEAYSTGHILVFNTSRTVRYRYPVWAELLSPERVRVVTNGEPSLASIDVAETHLDETGMCAGRYELTKVSDDLLVGRDFDCARELRLQRAR